MKAVLFPVLCWMSLGFVFAFPVETPDADRFQQFIQQLDSDRFTEREAAARELDRLGQAALPYLNAALAGKPSLEVRRRLEALIGTIRQRDPAYLRDTCETLISQLDCFRNDQAGRAALELRAIGRPALEHLRAAAQDRGLSPTVRTSAQGLILSIKRAHELPILPEDEGTLPAGCPTRR